MLQKKIIFKSGPLKLEGRLLLPPAASGTVPGVVFCHPHPLYGGNMHNNVTLAVGRALAARGMAVLLFNFRGVGLSEGIYDDGRGEIDDARAAISFLAGCGEIDRQRLGLGGYSFGATVALAAAMRDEAVKAVAAVSPPVLPHLSRPIPRLVICGTKDTLVPVSGILNEKERIAGDGSGLVEVVEGADHFWSGYEEKLAALVVAFYGRLFLN